MFVDHQNKQARVSSRGVRGSSLRKIFSLFTLLLHLWVFLQPFFSTLMESEEVSVEEVSFTITFSNHVKDEFAFAVMARELDCLFVVLSFGPSCYQ